jgi:hypothetical protein
MEKNQPATRSEQAKKRRGNPDIAELGRATRFAPGQSGNPLGQRRDRISAQLKMLMDQPCPFDKEGRTWCEAIAWAMVKKALRGDVRAFAEISDRVDGKPRQSIELSGPEGGAIPVGLEEVQKRIAELMDQAGLAVVRKDSPVLPPTSALEN